MLLQVKCNYPPEFTAFVAPTTAETPFVLLLLYGFTLSFFTDRHFFVGSFLICFGLLIFSSGRYLV
jgi:hypothetical protein